MEETKIIKFVLGKGFKFTGREISSKLVVSKNKDLEGNCVTLIMSKRKGLYFFHPIADIYLDYNKLQLIMPKHQPIFVSKTLFHHQSIKGIMSLLLILTSKLFLKK